MAKAVTIETLLGGDISVEQLKGLTFEQALKLLEDVVGGVESGNLPLDRAINSYEKGTALITHLRGLLSGAEEKLRMLQESSKKADG